MKFFQNGLSKCANNRFFIICDNIGEKLIYEFHFEIC